jgi:predicted alpha/beta hydrolase family esterase
MFAWDSDIIIPQQRKLMVSSAQNSSREHWCRRWVRFNEVPEKVPKVPEKV